MHFQLHYLQCQRINSTKFVANTSLLHGECVDTQFSADGILGNGKGEFLEQKCIQEVMLG